MAVVVRMALAGIPLLEIIAFIEIGGRIGVLNTLGILILGIVLGLSLLKRQGLATLRSLQQTVGRGEIPVAELIHGAGLALAGLLLVIPGFVTDALALPLLVPPIRLALGRLLLRRLRVVTVGGLPAGRPRGAPSIDGEFEVVSRPEPPLSSLPPPVTPPVVRPPDP